MADDLEDLEGVDGVLDLGVRLELLTLELGGFGEGELLVDRGSGVLWSFH